MKPIAILSNQIFNVENDKVIDNEINKVEVPQAEIIPENKFAETVYSNNFVIQEDPNPVIKEPKNSKDADFTEYPDGSISHGRIATAVRTEVHYNTVNISIEKVKGNKRITKVYDKLFYQDSDTEEIKNGIQIAVKSLCTTYENVGIGYNPSTDTFSWKETSSQTEPPVVSDEKTIFNIKDIKVNKTFDIGEYNPLMTTMGNFVVEARGGVGSNSISADSTVKTSGSSPVTSYSGTSTETIGSNFTFKEDDKCFYINNLKIATQINIYLGVASLQSVEYAEEVGYPYTTGLYVKTIPESLEITIKGDSYGINLNEIASSIGSGDKVVSFSGNELMQTTNNISVSDMYNKVIEKYADGKETAVLRCAMGSYKYINSRTLSSIGTLNRISYGGLAISTSDSTLPMTFKIGDIVEPYVYNWRSGKNVDYPLSVLRTSSAITPKQFQVIGVDIVDDGEIFQDITIIEYEEKAITTISPGRPLSTIDNVYEFTITSGALQVNDIIVTDSFYGMVKRVDTTCAIKVNDITKVDSSKTYECYII